MSLQHRKGSHKFIKHSLGYYFLDSDLMAESLDTTGLRSSESNQRLAMLGDAVLKQVILDDWYASGMPKGESPETYDRLSTADVAPKVTGTTRSLLLEAMPTWHW